MRFGRIASAWAYFYRGLALNQQVANPADREARAAKLKYAIEQLQPRLPKVKVMLGGEPPEGFVIRHGDKTYPPGVLGKLLPIDPGEAIIEAAAPGYVRDARLVTFTEGETTTIEFYLRPIPPKPPPPKMVEEKYIPTWVWVTAGASAASAVVSIIAFVDMENALDAGSKCEPRKPCDLSRDEVEAEEARANRALGLGIGFGVGAIGLLSATLVGGFVGETELVPDTALRLSPFAGPSSAGLSFEGRF
jgi:hypothetical protein